jgi:hypothetical protein
MTTLHALQNRVRPGAALILLILVSTATYFEFVYYAPPTLYSVALWIIVVPMLFAATVTGIRSHPLYQPVVYGGLIAIGTLQYLDGEWYLLAGLFVVGGIIGLIAELRNKTNLIQVG